MEELLHNEGYRDHIENGRRNGDSNVGDPTPDAMNYDRERQH